jgi:hypothetical protein
MGRHGGSLNARLGGSVDAGPADRTQLRRIFDWFVALDIPYETVSNLATDVLIKTPAELVDSIEAGFGGHCVEHAVLLTELLRESGFDARYVNADVHHPGRDGAPDVVVRMAKPLVLVRVDAGRMVCDPYYGRTVLPVPDTEPSVVVKDVTLHRTARSVFIVRWHRDGRLTGADVVREDSGIERRRSLFQQRYSGFSPFGVTAPYYQQMRPVRQAVYYDPELDCLLTHTAHEVHRLSVRDLPSCDWIPPPIRERIAALVPRSRRERVTAAAFLHSGVYTPYYRLLQPAPAVARAAAKGLEPKGGDDRGHHA